MELRPLRLLVALSETEFNVTQAAEQLHLVQSAVSQHLSRLEEESGVVLFHRQGKRITAIPKTIVILPSHTKNACLQLL